jgi:hypothetical protein
MHRDTGRYLEQQHERARVEQLARAVGGVSAALVRVRVRVRVN